jgi:hypothetical protein
MAVLALVAAVTSGALASPLLASGHGQLASSAKKCGKRKHRHKKRRCKRPPVPAPASIAISPASQDFGVPQIGGETRTFTITNVGGSTSGLPVPALTAPSAPDFSIGANGCTNLLPPGASCPIDVHVATNGAGRESATLTVAASPGGTVSASMTADIQA